MTQALLSAVQKWCVKLTLPVSTEAVYLLKFILKPARFALTSSYHTYYQEISVDQSQHNNYIKYPYEQGSKHHCPIYSLVEQ